MMKNDTENLTPEKWMAVDGYEGIYEVSNLGRVKSLSRVIPYSNNRGRPVNESILRPSTTKGGGVGYEFVGLKNNGKSKYFLVHRLVAQAFIPNPENKKTVNHIDFNIKNNSVDNLEWATNSEQSAHQATFNRVKRGSSIISSKLTESNIIEIKEMRKNGVKLLEIAEKYSVCFQNISKICLGETWKHA